MCNWDHIFGFTYKNRVFLNLFQVHDFDAFSNRDTINVTLRVTTVLVSDRFISLFYHKTTLFPLPLYILKYGQLNFFRKSHT